MPASEWIWSAEPTHAALVDMATWDAAQRMGRRHGNVRDGGGIVPCCPVILRVS